ncbi:MAG TPA: choice-of-anchor tandem repeat GloVer-containing protein [Bryobacteraceae bacterium]|nr:choice-of-anchor tandem repeat GloVer-containing protein [Bryobacteraceae bacterium]
MLIRTWILCLSLATMVSISAQPLTTVLTFNPTDGDAPIGPLVTGCDGNFYGTIGKGPVGKNSPYGAVFKLTPGGTLTTLHIFQESDGSNPRLGPFQASDGNFYGTTAVGGANGYGTVFQVTPAGVLTTLHNFSLGDGSMSYSGVIQGRDGNFYGTTSAGGANGQGTIFKITPDGAFTTLHSFAGSEGRGQFGLVQGVDGNFYGTTQGETGPGTGEGIVFKMTPNGALTVLYSFTFEGGQAGVTGPSGLIQASDGNFYGTANSGQTSIWGMVFKITPSGALTVLHSFVGTDGAFPAAGVIQGSDGNLYGTTSGNAGGYGDVWGTIFKLSPSGTLTTLYSFANGGGATPFNPMVEASDGNLYGTTIAGNGTVFKLQVSLPIGTVSGGSSNRCLNVAAVGNGASFTQAFAPGMLMSLFGTGLSTGSPQTVTAAPLPQVSSSGTSVTINGIPAALLYISSTQINLQIPYEVSTGTATLAVNAGGQSASTIFSIQSAAPGIFVDSQNGHMVPNESASAGSTIEFFLTGVGQVMPSAASGNVPAPGTTPVPDLPLTMTIGGVPVTPVYIGIPSWSVGVLQIDFAIPSTLGAGTYPVVVTIGNVSSNAALLTVTAL